MGPITAAQIYMVIDDNWTHFFGNNLIYNGLTFKVHPFDVLNHSTLSNICLHYLL